MDVLYIWMNKLEMAQARGQAIALRNYITAHSSEMATLVLAKVCANQQPLPKTKWELFLESIRKPIVIPSLLAYLIAFFVLLNSVFCGYVLWVSHGGSIKGWFSRCTLAWSLMVKTILIS
jgi:hypothetical protein